MRKAAIHIVILLSVFIILEDLAQKDDFPALKGPYLGQKPPGVTPETFVPGIVSGDGIPKRSPIAYSPDGRQVFWSTANSLMI